MDYDEAVIEIDSNIEVKSWSFMRFRIDKKIPNAHNTAVKTFQSINDPVYNKQLCIVTEDL